MPLRLRNNKAVFRNGAVVGLGRPLIGSGVLRTLELLSCIALLCSLTATAEEEEVKQARLVDAMARRSAIQSGRVIRTPAHAWGVDAFVTYAILDGQPQTDFYQGSGYAAGLEAHLMLWPWIGVEAVAQYASFGSLFNGPAGSVFLPAAGVRFDPNPGFDWGNYYLSAHAGDAFTAGIGRFGFDLGAGIEWDFGWWRLGPTLRFVDITSQPSAHQLGGDAHLILLGFSFGLGSKRPEVTLERTTQETSVPSNYGSLVGRVSDSAGAPLQARLIVASLDDSDEGEPEILAAAPDYEVRLRVGQYHLEASAPGYQSSGREVFVDVAEVAEGNFTLQPLPQPRSHEPPLAVLTATEIEVRQTIEFELDSARLKESAQPILNEVASILRQHPDLHIRIEGHTDDRGGDAYNLKLSEERAESVRSFLYGAGIRADRLQMRGYGLTRPLLPNDSEDNRARNRRVEFQILDPVRTGP